MRNYLVLGFVLISFLSKAQEVATVSAEKNLNSIQAGLLSLSFQNETRLDRKITFRTEIGLETGTSSIEYNDGHKENSFLILPFINLEPRWYYGLDRRSRLQKNTKHNSSNYFSLLTSFHSSGTALVNTKDFDSPSFITIVPEYGIRRSVGKHFFSEYSGGIGYRHDFFKQSYLYNYDQNEVIINIQLKFGYIF